MDKYLLTPEEITSILSELGCPAWAQHPNKYDNAVAEAQLAKALPLIREEVRKEESNRIRRELLKYNESGWEDENGHKCHKAILLNQKEWSRIFNGDIEGK